MYHRILLPILFAFAGRLVAGKSVGIIGGGIGGTSAAFLLSQLEGIDEIHLFEKSSKLGGRLETISVGGKEYEAGGSVIHPDNALMRHYVDILDLKTRQTPDDTTAETILFDGAKTLISFPEDGGWISSMTLLYRIFARYGWDFFSMRWDIAGVLGQFARIYPSLNDSASFPNVEDLLGHMSPDFPAMLNQTMEDYLLHSLRLSRPIVDELARVAIHVNNAQVPKAVQAFVGAVALAGTDGRTDPNLWAVEGGNRRVPQELAKRSGAKIHLGSQVSALRKNSEGWSLVSGGATHHFDAVILATPLERGRPSLKIEGVDPSVIEAASGTYHRLHVAFIQGTPRWSKWGYQGDANRDVLVTNPALPYISLGLQSPVGWRKGDEVAAGSERVWKVFSQTELTKPLIADMFLEVLSVRSFECFAYPDYAESSRPWTTQFRLAPGLYHPNAIEWAASAMEMAAIGAQNIVNLLAKDWELMEDVGTERRNEL